MMKHFMQISAEINKWSAANFGNTPVDDFTIVDSQVQLNWLAPLMGIGEEIGELAKQATHNMIGWKDQEEVFDAIADIGIYFADYLIRRGTLYDFDQCPTPEPKHFCIMLAQAYGELMHTELKHAQKIRGMDDPTKFREAHKTACSHLYKTLQMGCNAFVGEVFEDHVDRVFQSKVSKRNWKKYKIGGGE